MVMRERKGRSGGDEVEDENRYSGGVWVGTQRDMRLGLTWVILALWTFSDSFPLLPQGSERLFFLSMTLHPFQALLGGLGAQEGWTSSERIQLWAMRLDLRDLQRHLRFQVENPPTLLDPQRPKLSVIGSLLKIPLR